MVANGMNERGTSVRQLARQLGVTEGALRYRLKKLEEGPQEDGRSRQATALDGYEAVVEGIQVALEDGRLTGEGRPSQARTIYELLVRDHGYEGSYQSVGQARSRASWRGTRATWRCSSATVAGRCGCGSTT